MWHRYAAVRQFAQRPKAFRLQNPDLAKYVEDAMDDGWSPKLVSLVLKQTFGHDESMQVSHEKQFIRASTSGPGRLRKEISYRCLSTSRSKRNSHGERPRGNAGQHYKERSEDLRTPRRSRRPCPSRALGRRYHHRQRRHSAIGTLVERATRYTMLLHLPGRHAAQYTMVAQCAGSRPAGQKP